MLAMTFVVVATQVSYAQLDASALMRAQRQGKDITGGYGANPYDTGEQQVDENGNPVNGEQADTTKKKKPRKPSMSDRYLMTDADLARFDSKYIRGYYTRDLDLYPTTPEEKPEV